jgi:putative thiamine transport system substrate-binding protein
MLLATGRGKMRRLFLAFCLLLVGTASAAGGQWEDIIAKARGQTVYWNAWGGDATTNDFIAWVGRSVLERYGVKVVQVKLTDTADAVTRVLSEKTAGRNTGGTVDLVWINGANFAAMKRNGLLFGPFAQQLPNYANVDVVGKPTATTDFSVPVDGMESPWEMAQFVLVYDSARLPQPPRTIAALFDWARQHPGRFTYPQPPDFIGLTFLKQVLVDSVADKSILQQPASDANFDSVTAPLWKYMDELRPLLWHQGKAYPKSGPDQRQLLGDGEIDIALSFSPMEAATAISQGLLPATARVYVLNGGTIGNTNFVAIPFNANAKEGAMVVANFLLSAEAQARAQDPRYLGAFSLLDLNKLSPAERAVFAAIPANPAVPTNQELGTQLLEPHESWMERIQKAWVARYGAG